jgi:hypothetical protein
VANVGEYEAVDFGDMVALPDIKRLEVNKGVKTILRALVRDLEFSLSNTAA